MLVIYASEISPRLQYIVYNLPWKNEVLITYEKRMYVDHAGPKINYSLRRIDNNEIWISPHKLLFETSIKKQHYTTGTWNGLKTFFLTAGDINFDFFAASFYLLTRYEEYLPFTPDEQDNFPHAASLAHKENFIRLPLINKWYRQLEQLIYNKFFYSLQQPQFHFQATYDVDIAYKFKGESLNKYLLRVMYALIKKDFNGIKKIRAVRHGRVKDSFDVFDWLDELHESNNLRPLYFILMAKQSNEYDKNVLPDKSEMQQLIDKISSEYVTGIHPSWQSNGDYDILKEELHSLEEISQLNITASRQHYLKMSMPQTFRNLIRAGITNDYSMGYGGINGFRASYCMPYKWYDLKKDHTTSLTIHPFCFMDATAIFNEQLSVTEALAELKMLCNSVKEMNGEMITVFHNHLMGYEGNGNSWRKMYRQFIMNVMQLNRKAVAEEVDYVKA